MHLYEAENGWLGESYVRCYVWAPDEATARALAIASFRQEATECYAGNKKFYQNLRSGRAPARWAVVGGKWPPSRAGACVGRARDVRRRDCGGCVMRSPLGHCAYCGEQLWTSRHDCDAFKPDTPQGWQCPQCKRIYSPAVRECAACAPEATVGCTCLRFETDYRVFVQAMPDCPIHGQKKAE